MKNLFLFIQNVICCAFVLTFTPHVEGQECTKYFNEEMANFYPEGIIYLNFHFIQNSEGIGNFGPTSDNNSLPTDLNYTGIFIANDLIAKLNEYAGSVVAPNIQYNGQDVPSVVKLPWRFELYTDPENEDDLYDGVWFWENPNYETDLAQTNHASINKGYINLNFKPYGDQVMNVYLIEFDGTNTGQGGSTGNHEFYLYNTWKRYNQNMAVPIGSEHLHQAAVSLHEIGHIMTEWGHVNVGIYPCEDAATTNPLTNNTMYDEVAAWRYSWTPCQVNKMYDHFQNSPTREYYIPTNPCLLTSTPLIIETETIFNSPITLDSDIVIEENGKLTVNCLVNMPANGNIKINPGGELILGSEAKITSGCPDQLWNGILVYGNRGNLNVLQGRLSSEPNSIIENAKIAISNPWFNHPFSLISGFPGGGGIIDMVGTTFINNEISVRLYPYFSTNLGGNIIFPYTGKFRTCDFITNDNYYGSLNPVQAFIHGVNGPTFTNCNFINERTDVDNLPALGVGVASLYSGPKFYYSGPTIWPLTPRPIFQGYHRGIVAIGGKNTFLPIVTNHDFIQNVVGAAFMGIDQFSVTNCKFEIGGLTMPYNTEGNDFHEGISVSTSAEFNIRNNEFLAVNNPPDPLGEFDDPHKFGLRILNSGMNTTVVQNNKYNNLRIANKAEGLNRNPFNSSEGLSYKCNANDNEIFDFTVVPTKPEDGILIFQGALNKPAKNTFSNLSPSVSIGTDFYNQTSWPILYYFEDLPSEVPLNYFSDINFLGLPASSADEACGTIGVTTGTGGGGLINTDSINDLYIFYSDLFDSLVDVRASLIDNNSTSSYISAVNAATSENKVTLLSNISSLSPYTSDVLLAAIFERTSYFTSTEINSILNQNIHFYIYPYLKETLKENWGHTDSTLKSIFISGTSDLLNLESQISDASNHRFINSQYLIRHFQMDSINLDEVSHRTSEIENIERKFIQVGQRIEAKDFETAFDILDNIENEYSLSSRIDSIHDQYVVWTELMENLDLVPEDSTFIWLNENKLELEKLAENTITKPAAWARGLLYLLDIDYDYYWYPINIDEIIVPRSSYAFSLEQDNSLIIYPNPASNEISVVRSISKGNEAFMNIVDLSGKVVANYLLNNGIIHTFKIDHLPEGFYYLSLVYRDSFENAKFLKIK